MKRIGIRHRDLGIFFCFVLIVALFFSKFLLSVSMIALLVLAVLHIDFIPFNIRFNTDTIAALKRLGSHWGLLAFSLIFFIPLMSGLWSENLSEWVWRSRLRLPFVLLPIALIALPSWPKKVYHHLLYLLLICSFLSAFVVLYHYLANTGAALDAIGQGRSMWTPTNHIRYSLLIAYAIIVAFCLWHDKHYFRYFWERKIIAVIGTLLFFFLHFLAVRSGLAAFYFTALCLIIYNGTRRPIRFRHILLFGLFMAVPLCAVKFVPSLQQKWFYTKWDIEQFAKGFVEKRSDSQRLFSIKAGLDVWSEHPLLGVGVGDLKNEMLAYFKRANKPHYLFPHNQYVFTLTSTGILGLLLFLMAVYLPMFYGKAYRLLPLLSIQIIVALSFFVENTIETSLGVAIYAFFTCLGYKHLMDENTQT